MKKHFYIAILIITGGANAAQIPSTQYVSDFFQHSCHNPDLKFNNVGKNIIPTEHYVLNIIDTLNDNETDYSGELQRNAIPSIEYLKTSLQKLKYKGDCSFCESGLEQYPVSNIISANQDGFCPIGTIIKNIDVNQCRPGIDGLTGSCISGNPGTFNIGIGCKYNTSSTAYTSCLGLNCTSVIFKGESRCSAAGILPNNNFENAGGFCWCRITAIADKNGTLVPYDGPWVYRMQYVSGAAFCARYCAEDCTSIGGFNGRRAYRRILLAPINIY